MGAIDRPLRSTAVASTVNEMRVKYLIASPFAVMPRKYHQRPAKADVMGILMRQFNACPGILLLR